MMTDNVENLVLEMLEALRNEVKSQGVKMDEQFESVRLRLSQVGRAQDVPDGHYHELENRRATLCL